jgi:hypothetical protein
MKTKLVYNTLMNTVSNVKKVSLLFFIGLAGAHITSSLLLARGYGSQPLHIINGTFDVPAILAAVLYAFSSFKVYLEELGRDTMAFDMAAGVLGGIALIGAIVVNFFF